MPAHFRPVLAPLLALTAFIFSPAVSGAATPDDDPEPPETQLELYNLTFECMLYFDRMVEGLQRSGASQTEIKRYDEMRAALPWLLVAVGERLSQEEQKRAVTGRDFRQRLDGLADVDALRDAYDRRCVDAYANFDSYSEAIEQRLIAASGEPFPDLIERCVTLSTGLMTVTGQYLGMTGPSVKPVPKGGLAPVNLGDGDRYRIALPRGTVAEWNARELPRPPATHTRLLGMMPDEQAATLADALARFRRDCKRPDRPYFRGRDHWGRAYWAVSCAKRQAYCLVIDEDDDLRFGYDCKRARDGDVPDCYEPCTGMGCFTSEPSVSATIEQITFHPTVSVKLASPGQCADEIRAHEFQFRDDLPILEPGKAHRLVMSTADAPECKELRSAPDLMLEIYSTERLDMLKVDLAMLDIPHARPDVSAGAPCELVHLDPAESEYADLRCRLVADVDALLAAGPTLIVRGRFTNGDSFEGEVEACR